MVEKRTRRRFTAEFKARAVERLLEGGKPFSEVATLLGYRTPVEARASMEGITMLRAA